MARVNRVLRSKTERRCEKCGAVVKVGEPYLWWQFRYGGRHERCAASSCFPRRQDLTQSDFWKQAWTIEDELSEVVDSDGLEALVEEIEALADEREDAVSNMPDQLQDGSTAQARAEAVREWAEEARGVLDDAPVREDYDSDAAFQDASESWLDSVRALGYGGE